MFDAAAPFIPGAPPPVVNGVVIPAHPTAAPEPLPITARLVWADGYEERVSAWARGWTRDAVLVDAHPSRGHYRLWLPASDVGRRVLAPRRGSAPVTE